MKKQPAFVYHQTMYRAVLTLLVGLMLSISTAFITAGFAWASSQQDGFFTCKKLSSQVGFHNKSASKNQWLHSAFKEKETFFVSDFEAYPDYKKKNTLKGKLSDKMIGREAYTKSATNRDVNLLARANVTLLKNDELIIHYGSLDYGGYRMKYFCKGAFEKILLAKDTQSNETAIEVTGRQNDENSSAQTKIEQLEKELAKLRNNGAGATSVVQDGIQIRITKAEANGPRGEVEGEVLSKNVIDRVTFDDEPLKLENKTQFAFQTYVPDGGTTIVLRAVDVAGISTSVNIRLDRSNAQPSVLSFDKLNPINRLARKNLDSLALIIGISDYKETVASANYADRDAKAFADFAAEKLGVPRQRIKTLVNDGADEKDVLLAAKRWLARGAIVGQSDIYVFFAGHGLASDDGETMYLLPYDGAPELLEDTAVSRERLFSDIAAANPRTVTVFLDTCYSGTTRGPDMLIASRPIAIRAKEQAVPEGFTVMTAAAGDQTAKPLEEAKHGMFSYFLMKGMEGDADANQDNQITATELHAYVQQNVIQQSSGSQTPELQGDADRVLVRFQ